MRLAFLSLAIGLATALGAQADDGAAQSAPVEDARARNADGGFSEMADLVLRALAYVGVRYKYGGDSPATGFDCSGLVFRVFNQAAGLMLPHDSRQISEIGKTIGLDELKPGDLVFFDTRREPFSHVGIYLGQERFIHAPTRGGQVEIVNMGTEYWRKHYNGARRIIMGQSY